MKNLSPEEMLNLLKDAVKKAGSQKAWAEANNVSPQYVSDCLNMARQIGISVALPLGYVPVTVYVPAETIQTSLSLKSKRSDNAAAQNTGGCLTPRDHAE